MCRYNQLLLARQSLCRTNGTRPVPMSVSNRLAEFLRVLIRALGAWTV
jgi:hypothetical protein